MSNVKSIVSFNWDNGKGEEWNGNHLMIGQLLPKKIDSEFTCIEIYGIALDIACSKKDYQLKHISCHHTNLASDVKEITKDAAREMLIAEIDKALDILFDPAEMEMVHQNLNVPDEAAENSEVS